MLSFGVRPKDLFVYFFTGSTVTKWMNALRNGNMLTKQYGGRGIDERFYSDTETQYGEGEEEEELLKDEMNVDADSVPIPPTWPYHSICFVEPGRGGLAVAYTAKGLVGYLHATDGTLQHQERLHFANNSLPCPNQPLFGGKFCYIDDNKFSLVLSGMINGSYCLIGL